MCEGPVEQFKPITSIGSASSVAHTALMSVPSSMRPVTSSVACAWIGTRRTPLPNARVMPAIAAFISSRSWLVSSSSRSTPPSISAADCSSYRSASSSNVIFESAGSDDEISIPVGPSEPATKRGRSGVA